MKIKVLIILILISNILYSNVELLINNYSPYVGEVTSIIVSGPKKDGEQNYSLGISKNKYRVIISQEVEDSDQVKFMVKLIFHNAEVTNLTPMVNGILGEEKEITVISVPNSKSSPFTRVSISRDWAFAGEVLLYGIDLFSKEFIGDITLNQQLLDNEYLLLEPGVNKNIYMGNGGVSKVKRVVNYGLYSNSEGIFQIPGGTINLNNKEVLFNPIEMEIHKLPNEVTKEFLIGKDITIDILKVKRKYHYNSPIEFYIKVKGNSNLSQLSTLREYSKALLSYHEALISEDMGVINNNFYYEKVFKYSKLSNSLIGITTPKVTIPIYDTETYTVDNIVLNPINTKGTFNIPVLILLLVIVLILLFYMVIIIAKWIKNSTKGTKINIDEFYNKYNLSNREKDILLLLIPGKSNKDIASELNISPETVKKHIQNILKKSSKNSRIELIAEIAKL